MPTRSWITAGLPPGVYDLLAERLAPSRLWSLLMQVVEARAARRRVPDLAAQWAADRFVQPSIVDQRQLLELDRELLAAASAFESIELSPVAPLGVCSSMRRASQNKVLSALRGTEVVADPTNVLALECARRLRAGGAATVRLATSHRALRAQDIPKGAGFTTSFRMFCLASAGFERQDHEFVVAAIVEHVVTLLAALDRLDARGYSFPKRRVTILAGERLAPLGDRIASRLPAQAAVERARLDHLYYSGGLRFQIAAAAASGVEIPLADGGAFDWVATILSNRKAVYVASGIGSQLAAVHFRRPS